MTDKSAQLHFYMYFDLDDVDAVKRSRAELEHEVEIEGATVDVLALTSVAAVRLSAPVDDPSAATDEILRISEDARASALSSTFLLVTGDLAGRRAFLSKRCHGDIHDAATTQGTVCTCESQRFDESRVFALTPDAEVAPGFLDESFPKLDLAIRRLELQASACERESTRVSRARREADEAIGRALHENIVMRAEGPDRVDQMHAETEQLTSMYGVLANDSVILQETLDRLGDFAKGASRAIGRLSDGHDSGIDGYIERVATDARAQVQGEQAYLHTSLDKAKTAIDVVRTHVELDRSDQNLKLTERATSLQVAAGFIEFILIFYYVEHSWEPLAGAHRFEAIPVWMRFGLVLAFSAAAVAATHQMADAVREHEPRRWMSFGLLCALMALLVAGMFIVSIYFADMAG